MRRERAKPTPTSRRPDPLPMGSGRQRRILGSHALLTHGPTHRDCYLQYWEGSTRTGDYVRAYVMFLDIPKRREHSIPRAAHIAVRTRRHDGTEFVGTRARITPMTVMGISVRGLRAPGNLTRTLRLRSPHACVRRSTVIARNQGTVHGGVRFRCSLAKGVSSRPATKGISRPASLRLPGPSVPSRPQAITSEDPIVPRACRLW